MKNNSKILICYNSPASIFSIYNGRPTSQNELGNDLSETAFSKEIKKIENALLNNFSEVKTLAVDRNIKKAIDVIERYSPDAIINFVESVEGVASYEYCMAGVYELMGYHFTGNTPICLGNCLNKEGTKNILRSMGVNTPSSQIVRLNNKFTQKDFLLNYPVILKLLREDASIGISELSVVNNFNSLKKQLNFLQNTYKQDVIIEEYIDGRELNVAILGDNILPISEIKFNGLPENLPKIVTYDGKWIEDSLYYKNTVPECPAKINKKLKKKIEDLALLAYNVMGCRDYARVDVRVSKEDIPFIIEVNPNPDISSDSGFVRAAAAAGISYTELINKIAGFALERKQYDSEVKAG
jgi:D-alanine-D-alanine ligase